MFVKGFPRAQAFFATFYDTLLLGVFADSDLPNARIGALINIAFYFAIELPLFLISYRSAAPMLPDLRRL